MGIVGGLKRFWLIPCYPKIFLFQFFLEIFLKIFKISSALGECGSLFILFNKHLNVNKLLCWLWWIAAVGRAVMTLALRSGEQDSLSLIGISSVSVRHSLPWLTLVVGLLFLLIVLHAH